MFSKGPPSKNDAKLIKIIDINYICIVFYKKKHQIFAL